MLWLHRLAPRSVDHRTVAIAWLIPLLALFGPVFVLDRTFAFRDAAHYYAPLYRYVQAQWTTGLPLWNPLEENGRPLLADPTAGVLYPGKLVFALPVRFETGYKLYVLLHLLLAGGGTYRAARVIGTSVLASGMAALAYTFGGSVFFQYCNVIYLVGAAWLPWGIAALVRLLTDQPWRGILELSAVLASTVLGGDPQTAYLIAWTGLVFVVVAACHGRRRSGRSVPPIQNGIASAHEQSGRSPHGPKGPSSARWILQRTSGLGLACAFGCALAAVQIVPSWEWARGSERAVGEHPDSTHNGPAAAVTHVFDTPTPGSHREVVYRFSIGPWRWPELLWPTWGGRPFPVHQRWIDAIPAEAEFWTPSLYMGLWPALLGLFAVRLRRPRDWRQACLSWWVVAAVLSCLGWYGIGWFCDEVRFALGWEEPAFWRPIGGLYWLMTIVLPGFALFRYPAKLWCLAALGLSLLAAQNLQRFEASNLPRWRRRMFAAAILLGAILFTGAALRSSGISWLPSARPNALFGPFDQQGAEGGFLRTGGHLWAVLLLSWIWLSWPSHISRRWQSGLLIGTAIELAIAQAWMVPTVPTALCNGATTTVAQQMKASDSQKEGDSPPTYLRQPILGWYPSDWSKNASARRLEECVQWDRATLRPKYNLDTGIRAARSTTSFTSADYRAVLRLLDRSRVQDRALYEAIQDALGVAYRLEPVNNTTSATGKTRMVLPDGSDDERIQLVQRPSALPNAWLVYRAHRLPPLSARSWPALEKQTEQAFRAAGGPRNLREEVTLEIEGPSPLRAMPPSPRGDRRRFAPSECCTLVENHATRMVVEATLPRAGFLVIRDACAPGWQSYLDQGGHRSRLPILRANRVMRAVALPAGEHRVVFEYRPRSVLLGGLISTVSWLFLAACGIQRFTRFGAYRQIGLLQKDRREGVNTSR